MSRNYKFHNLEGIYFISFAVAYGLLYKVKDYCGEKVEELTLYLIKQQEQLNKQAQEIEKLKTK